MRPLTHPSLTNHLYPSTGQMTVFQHATELADECYNRLSDDEVWSDFEKAGPDWDVLHDWSIFQKYDLAPLGRGWER